MKRVLDMARRAEHVASQLYNTPMMLDGQTAEEQGIDVTVLSVQENHSYNVVQQLTAHVWDTLQHNLQDEEKNRGVFKTQEDRRSVVRLMWYSLLSAPIGTSEGEGYQHHFDDLHEELNAALNIGELNGGLTNSVIRLSYAAEYMALAVLNAMSHAQRVSIFERFYALYAPFVNAASDQTPYLQDRPLWYTVRNVFMAWLLDAVYTAYGVTLHTQDTREFVETVIDLLRDMGGLQTILTIVHEQRTVHRSVPTALQQVVDEAETVLAAMTQRDGHVSPQQQLLALWSEWSTGAHVAAYDDEHSMVFHMEAAAHILPMESSCREQETPDRITPQIRLLSQEHIANHAGLLSVDGILRLSGAIVVMGVSSYDLQYAIVQTLYDEQHAVLKEAESQGIPLEVISALHHDVKLLVEVYLLSRLGAATAAVTYRENIPREWQEPMVSERLKALITEGNLRDLGAALVQEHVEHRARLDTAQAALAKHGNIV